MPKHLQIQALLLHARPKNDWDLRIQFLSPQGLDTCTSYGSRSATSRKQNHLQIGTYADLTLRVSKHDTLSITECRTLQDFQHIHQDFQRIALLHVLLETLVYTCAPGVPYPLWKALLFALQQLEQAPYPTDTICAFLILHLSAEGLLSETLFASASTQSQRFVRLALSTDLSLFDGNRPLLPLVAQELLHAVNRSIHAHCSKNLQSLSLFQKAQAWRQKPDTLPKTTNVAEASHESRWRR